jgi:predicted small lipoprotein YifL
MKKGVIWALLLLIMVGSVSACGKRAKPVPPDGSSYPEQTYPGY